ncbi:MAG TPA: rhombotarget lipoprotein [Mariprofundaceae bacterium]|nr:rhombotarget lipoprotein [Mariprofundaceae bacterium]
MTSCATGMWGPAYKQHEASSVVDYLYPKSSEPPSQEPVTHLRLPVRVGIAFVPSSGHGDSSLSEESKIKLLNRAKMVFEKYPYIDKIEVIPSAYLRAAGGFDNLEQVGRMFGIEVIALISYDQIQFDDPNKLSLLYWTIVGAYVIKGDQHDTQTMVDASVFDIASRKMLFRAPGVSTIKGSTTMVNYQEEARMARQKGYEDAVAKMLPNLEQELLAFKERIKQNRSVQIEHKPGYKGGGSLGWFGLLMAGMIAFSLRGARRLS